MPELIEKGSKNRWVGYLQKSLICLGYYIGPTKIDDNFGENTYLAVINFQSDNGLEQDGKVGDKTWEKIMNKIKPIQRKLIENKCLAENEDDGIYGNATTEAVKKFQESKGLKVDGLAGPDTQNALFGYNRETGKNILVEITKNVILNTNSNRGIRNTQNALYALNYNIGSTGADGILGENTKNALKKFQYDHNLTNTGELNIKTLLTIQNEIFQIQLKLREKGMNLGSCGSDGICGNCTIKAIKEFQRINNLKVDGIIGEQTRMKLFSSSIDWKYYIHYLNFFPILYKYAKNYIYKTDDINFLSKSNSIIRKLLNISQFELEIKEFNEEKTIDIGNFQIKVKAEKGAKLSIGSEKFYIKGGIVYKKDGIDFSLTNFINKYIQEKIVPNFKKKYKIFKQKIGEAVVDGKLTIEFKENKLIFKIAIEKEGENSKKYLTENYYGTLTISIEFKPKGLRDIINKIIDKIEEIFKKFFKDFKIDRDYIFSLVVIIVAVIIIVSSISTGGASLLVLA